MIKSLTLGTLEKYCQAHSSTPDQLLDQLDRETHLTTIAPQMSAGPFQGMLLHLIGRLIRPKRILEIGTFTGYATLCLARCLDSNGTMDTIEVDPERETVVRKYLEADKRADQVQVHIGDAMEIVPELPGSYELIYVDAGKRDYQSFYRLCLPRLSDRGLMIFDNVLWGGKVISDPGDRDAAIMGAFNRMVLQDERVMVSMLPVRDGMSLVTKR